MNAFINKILEEALDFENLQGIQKIGSLDYEDNTRHVRFKNELRSVNLMIDYLSPDENIRKNSVIPSIDDQTFYVYWAVFDNLKQYKKSTYKVLINIYKSIVNEIKMFIQEKQPNFIIIAGNLKEEEEQTFDLTQKGKIYKTIIEKHLSMVLRYVSIERNVENEKVIIICKKELINEIK